MQRQSGSRQQFAKIGRLGLQRSCFQYKKSGSVRILLGILSNRSTLRSLLHKKQKDAKFLRATVGRLLPILRKQRLRWRPHEPLILLRKRPRNYNGGQIPIHTQSRQMQVQLIEGQSVVHQ